MWKIFSRSAAGPLAGNCTNTPAQPSADDTERIASALLARITASETALPIVHPDAILAHHDDRIVRTRQLLGLSGGIFEQHVLPVFWEMAAFCNTLPASNRTHYRYPLGAFGFAVDVAHNCAQSAAGAVFEPGVSAEDRPLLEPRWRLAATLAGLCREMHRIAHECKVTHGEESWGPYSESLYDWASRIGASQVFIRWLSTAAAGGGGRDKMAANAYLARSVIPPATISYLYAGSERIARSFLDYLAGCPETTNPIAALVDRCRAATLQRQLETESRNYGVPVIGIHLEPLLVEAIRARILDGTWTVNQKGSVVFATDVGVYLKWPVAARDISRYLTEQKVVSAPADADALQRVAEQARIVVEARTAGGQWLIQPDTCNRPITALRLASAAVAFADRPVPPLIHCEAIVNVDSPIADAGSITTAPTATHTVVVASTPQAKGRSRRTPSSQPPAGPISSNTPPTAPIDNAAPDEADIQEEAEFPAKVVPSRNAEFIKQRAADVKEFAERYVIEKVLSVMASATGTGRDAVVVTVDSGVYLLENFFGSIVAVPKELATKTMIKHKVCDAASERNVWASITYQGDSVRGLKVNADIVDGLALSSRVTSNSEGAA